MTKEEKEILMQDLCGRLPYKLYCDASNWTDEEPRLVLEFCPYYDEELKVTLLAGRLPVEYCRPYLRPISSMTDEEKKELQEKFVIRFYSDTIRLRYHSEGYWDTDLETSFVDYLWLEKWLNIHHFDYRGLIEKGLAVEAPEDMYKPKNS